MAKKGDKFNQYNSDFKVKVVNAYLSGKYGGFLSTSKSFGLRSKTQLQNWVKIYKEHGPLYFLYETRGRATKADGIRKGRPVKKCLEDMTLEEQVAYLKMENDILKKVQALRKR